MGGGRSGGDFRVRITGRRSREGVDVVASTSVWGSVAAAVGGQRVVVRSLIADTVADPHSFEATPADAAAITDAALVVYNGGDYDHFVDEVLATEPGVNRINAFAVGGHAPGSNPHVFYDLKTVSSVANAIAERLGAIDPAGANEFKANAEKFNAGLAAIAENQERIAAAHRGTPVVASEDIAYYLQTAVGLADKTPAGYYRAVDGDSDPAPVDVAAMLDLIDSRSVRVVLVNPQTETPVTKRIADAANMSGVPVVEVTETLPEGLDFVTWQQQTVDRLAQALQATR